MRLRLRLVCVTAVVLAAGWWWLTATARGRSAQFVIGGALVNLGYRMQDHLVAYDFDHAHEHEITPEQVWQEMRRQNAMAAGVRRQFPRSARHPLVAMVVCMDARIDTSELTGDTRKYYYVIRTAGSVLEPKEAEMLELAVQNGVKLILLTTHTDCAAERAANDPALRQRLPHLTRAVLERSLRVRELLARPALAERLARGELAIKQVDIDTMTEELRPR